MKRDRIVFDVLVLAAIFMVLATSATATENRLLLDPDNSVSDGTPVQVVIYTDINETDKAMAASFDIVYDPNCIQDFPSFDTTGSGWLAAGSGAAATCSNPAPGVLRFSSSVGMNPAIDGHVLFGTLTITCNTTCCGSFLNFTRTPKYTDGSMGTVYPALDNGTFLCNDPSDPIMTVTKEVLDGSNWVDTIGPLGSEWMDKDVRFKITVTAGCLDLSGVAVDDVMDVGLEYNDSATLAEDSSTAHTVNWTIGALAAGTSQSIEFNATIAGYGTNCNTATVTGTVTSLGADAPTVSDDACVTTMPPAGINVTKTVWDESTSSWVDMVTGATIGDTYRFRCEVENIGSLGMDVCDITVQDVLPDGLSYADNATLQDHHGGGWSLPNPPAIYDPANNTYGWIINNTVPGECLQVGQKIVIEYDATVENYGLSCNNITADAYCLSATSWVQNNDSACIDTPAPDLTVTDIEVNYDGSSCGGEAFGPLPPNGTNTQPNNISADITELNGIAVVFPFDVTFEIRNGGTVVAIHTAQLPGIAAGATETVYCDNVFFPIAGETYTINVTVDSADDVIETNETNNLMQLVKTAIVNGYKGGLWQDGRTIGKMNCIQGNVNIVRSLGDSSYVSSYYYPDWTDYDVVWTPSDLPIPTAGTSIKKARLYVYYQTDKTPAENITDYFKLEFNGYELPIVASFKDAKGFGSSDYTSPVGMIAYDVSHKVQIGNNDIANLTNQVPGGGNVTISGMMLIVVYENSAEPERMIWINEGLDIVYAKDVYNINSTEATAHGAFTDCYPLAANMSKATLVTVAPLGNSATGTKLFFNGHEFLGAWPAYSGSTHVCLAEHAVSSYLSSTANTFAFQSYKPAGAAVGDFMAASNAILIVEKQNPEMSAEPDSDECYAVGEEFDVLINITPKGVPIMGAQFDLDFNESALFAETVTYGDFLTQDDWTNIFVADSDIDNLNGVVSFAAARQGTPDGDGVTGTGTFAIVHFTAVTQGVISELNLTNALASDNSTPVITYELVTANGTAEVCSNAPPVVVATSNFTYNNIAERGLSKAYFIGTGSHDPDDGTITLYEWGVDDGTNLVGEIAEHLFEVPMYWQGDQNGHYVNANVTLKVTDNGMPLMDNSTTMPVIVYIAGDATGDGRVNIADGVTFGMQFGKSGANIGNPDKLCWEGVPEGDKADLNNDGRVNIGDAMLLGTAWGHTAW